VGRGGRERPEGGGGERGGGGARGVGGGGAAGEGGCGGGGWWGQPPGLAGVSAAAGGVCRHDREAWRSSSFAHAACGPCSARSIMPISTTAPTAISTSAATNNSNTVTTNSQCRHVEGSRSPDCQTYGRHRLTLRASAVNPTSPR